MSTFITGRLEARGMTANSKGLENFLNSVHRPYGDSFTTTLNTRPSSSYTSQTRGSFVNQTHSNYNNNSYAKTPPAFTRIAAPRSAPSTTTTTAFSPQASTTPALLLRYLNPKEMKLDLNGNVSDPTTAAKGASPTHSGFTSGLTTRGYRSAQSAGPSRPSTKRQIAVQCGIKTIPFDGRRWKNEKNTPSSASPSGKSQIMFQEPQDGNQSRRGLRGSKVRPGASTPRPASQARQKRYSLDTPLGYREGSVVSTPRHLSVSSLQHSQASLNGPVTDEGESQESTVGYGWNESDQGLRLQKHLSNKTSTRAMRRVSEMVHHRLDPMYKISGSKVTLQDRYSVDGEEMQKLQEMTITREELLSDLRKMKFHNPRSNDQTSSQKHRLLQQNISRLQQPSGNPSSVYPPSPTSDFDAARNHHHHHHHNNSNNHNANSHHQQQQQHKDEDENDNSNNNGRGGGGFKPLSQTSEEDIIDIIDDDDGVDDGDDDDDDEFGDKTLRGEQLK